MIKIYKISDYKNSGGLKKSARALMYNNTDEHGGEDRYVRLATIIIEEGFYGFKSPYFFTNIIAFHKEHGEVRIIQDINVGGQELMTTPKSLYENLTK